MNYIFKCTKCNKLINGFIPNVCENCGHHIKDENGIFIFTQNGNVDINSDNKYIGFDIIAPNYDSSRGRSLDSLEGEIVGDLLGAGKIVLEIGAGTGYHAIPMAKKGCNVIAGDISVNMLKILIRKMGDCLNKRLLPCNLDAYSLPIADNSVDAVFIDHVFHLIEKPENVLMEIKRVLKHNGYFINILYSGKILSTDEESKEFQEIVSKINRYYASAVKTNGMQLLERFGWIGQKEQQENIIKNFPNFRLIENESLVKKGTSTIRDILNEYRNLVLVSQAHINREKNEKIMDGIEDALSQEYGKEYVDKKIVTADKTSIQIFNAE